MIIKYVDFISENSKNDSIREIIEDRICIILLGAPGLGKSYFIKNYIIPRRNIKTFSTDDVSHLYTKDPNKYYQLASDLNIGRIMNFIPSGNSFIYDTTGSHPDQIFRIVQKAKKNNYKIIFIHLFGTLELSLRQNKMRNRNVDPEYIEFSYKTQFTNMKIYANQ